MLLKNANYPFDIITYDSCKTLNSERKEDIVHHDGESSICNALFNMINSMMGAALVGLPYIFHCGLLSAILIMIIFAIITIYSLTLLIISAELCQVQNYEDLSKYCFGSWGYITVILSMLLGSFGVTTSNLLILKSCISDILVYCGLQHTINTNVVQILFCVFVIFPWCLPTNIAKVETISKCSVASSILITIFILYEWLQRSRSTDTLYSDQSVNWFVEWNAIPESVGIIAFLFVCQSSAFLMYNTLKNPTIKRWRILSLLTSLIGLIVFTLFGVFGYLLFGDHLYSNILDNFPTTNILSIVMRIIYCFTTALTYPIAFFVIRHVCYTMYYYKENRKIKYASFASSLWFTTSIFAITVTFGIYANNLGIVMSLTGSIPSIILAFIMPSLCYLKCIYNKGAIKVNITTLPAISLLLIGIFISIFCTAITVNQQF